MKLNSICCNLDGVILIKFLSFSVLLLYLYIGHFATFPIFPSKETYKVSIYISIYKFIYIYIYIYICMYISEHKKNAHNDENRALALETLLFAIKMCTGFTTYVIWVNTKVYSVTSELTQSSSRRVSSFMDSSALLYTYNAFENSLENATVIAIEKIFNKTQTQ